MLRSEDKEKECRTAECRWPAERLATTHHIRPESRLAISSSRQDWWCADSDSRGSGRAGSLWGPEAQPGGCRGGAGELASPRRLALSQGGVPHNTAVCNIQHIQPTSRMCQPRSNPTLWNLHPYIHYWLIDFTRISYTLISLYALSIIFTLSYITMFNHSSFRHSYTQYFQKEIHNLKTIYHHKHISTAIH